MKRPRKMSITVDFKEYKDDMLALERFRLAAKEVTKDRWVSQDGESVLVPVEHFDKLASLCG